MQVDRAGVDDAPPVLSGEIDENEEALSSVALVVLVQPTGASGHSVPRRQLCEALLAGQGFSLVLIEGDAGDPEPGRGLDLFDTRAAVETFLGCLEGEDSTAVSAARRRYDLALSGQEAPPAFRDHAHAAALATCERRGLAALTRRFEDRLSGLDLALSERERVALRLSAQRFYRALFLGAPSARQLRRDVMLFALLRSLEHEGPGARAAVLAEGRDFARAVQDALGAARVQVVELDR